MTPVHLLVLVHGMWGNPGHLVEMTRKIRKAYNTADFHLLVAETNVDDYTYDGVDHGGERVADEVKKEVEKLRKDHRDVTKFSITGYSLGGLVSRYVIGILHQQKFFDNVTPINFNTFATPHIGLPRYPNFYSALATSLGPTFLSRTGEQFFALDKWSSTGRPLLAVMADPDRIFYKALVLFPHITIYANSVNDMTVPYVTAAIELEDPFLDHLTNGIEITIHKDYSNLIESYHLPTDGDAVKARSAAKHKPPLLPVPFPYNLMIYLSLPILVPAALSVVVVRISLAAHSSRRRIKLLEKDESYNSKLIHIVAELEREMEHVTAELASDPSTHTITKSSITTSETSEDNWWRTCSSKFNDHPIFCSCKRKQKPDLLDPNGSTSGDATEKVEDRECRWHAWRRKQKQPSGSRPSRSHTPSPSPSRSSRSSCSSSDEGAEGSRKGCSYSTSKKKASSADKPILTELQKGMIVSLNKIPNLKKELAFFGNVRSSHGVIVCRDDGRFTQQSPGDGAIKHWADNFVF